MPAGNGPGQRPPRADLITPGTPSPVRRLRWLFLGQTGLPRTREVPLTSTYAFASKGPRVGCLPLVRTPTISMSTVARPLTRLATRLRVGVVLRVLSPVVHAVVAHYPHLP